MLNPQFVVDRGGRRRSVLLPIEEYEELLECAQDVVDAALIDEVRGADRLPWEEIKARQTRRRRS